MLMLRVFENKYDENRKEKWEKMKRIACQSKGEGGESAGQKLLLTCAPNEKSSRNRQTEVNLIADG